MNPQYAPFRPSAAAKSTAATPAWSNVRGYGYVTFEDRVRHPAMRLERLPNSAPNQRVHLNPNSLTPRHPPPDYMMVSCARPANGGSQSHCVRLLTGGNGLRRMQAACSRAGGKPGF